MNDLVIVPKYLLEIWYCGFLKHCALTEGGVYNNWDLAYDSLMDFMYNRSDYQKYLQDKNRNLPNIQEFYDWAANEDLQHYFDEKLLH